MLNIRRRSTAWVRELVNSPYRIDVAPIDTETGIEDQRLENESDKVNNGISEMEVEKISLEEITRADDHEPFGPRVNEVNKCVDPKIKHFLEHYMTFLHYVGLASFREYWNKTTTPTHIMHKILFGLLGTLALSDSVKMIKLCNILYAEDGNMYRYVVLGRHTLNGVKRFFFLAVVSTGSKGILTVFENLATLTDSSQTKNNNKRVVVAIGVGITSLAVAVIGAMFGSVVIGQEWSPSKGVLMQSFEISLSLFVWTTNTTTMIEEYVTLHKIYAKEFTSTTVSFGIVGMIMESFGSLLDYANNDIMLFAALTMYKLTTEFQLKMMQRNCNMNDIVKQYRQLQKASGSLEEAFGWLFKLSHATNLLCCAYFVLILVTTENYYVAIIMLVFQILKVGLTYNLAIRSTAANKSLRRCARAAVIDCDTMDYDTKLILTTVVEESMESPIGLGSDNFFIDETFMLKFATMVATFSLFLIESEKNLEG